jgi:hypothetical protein
MKWLITYTNSGWLQHPQNRTLVLCAIHHSPTTKISRTRASLQTSSYHNLQAPGQPRHSESSFSQSLQSLCISMLLHSQKHDDEYMVVVFANHLLLVSYCICMCCDSCVLSVTGVKTKEKPLCERDTNIVTPWSCSLCCRLWRCGRSWGCFPAKDSSLIWACSS